jgi:hypothetical protein
VMGVDSQLHRRPRSSAGIRVARFLGGTIGRIVRLLSREPLLDGRCAACTGPARYGYSEHAETRPKDIRSMCLDCLIAQLRSDYRLFDSRAVVVQPTPGPPVYVFQSAAEWASSFPDSQITKDVARLLERMNPTCGQCGSQARFLWVESAGLTEDNFDDVLDVGISRTSRGTPSGATRVSGLKPRPHTAAEHPVRLFTARTRQGGSSFAGTHD